MTPSHRLPRRPRQPRPEQRAADTPPPAGPVEGADRLSWDEFDDAEMARLLTRPKLPALFERWRITLGPDTQRPSRPIDWSGAVVFIEQGQLEVASPAGERRTFGDGDLLPLGRLPLRTLRNTGDDPVRLVAVRRAGDESHAAGLLRVIRRLRG